MTKEKVDLIIEGDAIITVDNQRRVITTGAVAVKGSRIVAVDKIDRVKEMFTAERTIGGKGKVIMPGLIDCHSHIHQSLVKSLPLGQPPGKGPIWIRVNTPFEAAMTKDDASIAASLGCVEMLKSGTTCYADAGPFNPANTDVVAEIIKEAGLRSALARGSFDILRYEAHSKVPGFEPTDTSVSENETFIRRWNGAAEGRIRAWVASSSIWANSDDYFIKNKALVDKNNVGLHTHLNYAREEIALAYSLWGRRPLEHLADIGILSHNFLAVHMTLLTDEEIRLIKASSTNVVHCPRTNLGVEPAGVIKAPQMIHLGIDVALGTDTKGGDIFDAMRLASYAHFIAWGMPYGVELPLSFEDLIEMATINGARALGLGGQIGSIEPGKRADIIILDFHQPHLTPSHNLPAEIVRFVSGRDVEAVLVDGKIVVEDHRVKTVDEEATLQKASEATKAILERAGLVKYLSPSRKFQYV